MNKTFRTLLLVFIPAIALLSCGSHPAPDTVDAAIRDRESHKGNALIKIESKDEQSISNDGFKIIYTTTCTKSDQPGSTFNSKDSVRLFRTGDGIYTTQ